MAGGSGGDMKEQTYDNILILLAILAPILLIVLSKWQASLIRWYVPLNDSPTAYFSSNLESDIRALSHSNQPAFNQAQGATLFFIADKTCPCTTATLSILKNALQVSSRQDVKLVVIDVHSPQASTPAWQRILQQIPSTPTLLVMDEQRLVYAGPVTAGNMCTTSVLKILGISVLQSEPQKPVINWLEEGCYCPLDFSMTSM